ncbi:MAG TPA: PfkB family carbohydrate kinase, partial [Gallionella sp.]
IAQRVKALIVTLGADGSLIHADGKQIAIPTPKPEAVVDPTGCGDAYRAGLLYGIQLGWDWETTGRLASLMGSLKIANRGGQNHSYTRAELAGLYEQHFGHSIKL